MLLCIAVKNEELFKLLKMVRCMLGRAGLNFIRIIFKCCNRLFPNLYLVFCSP